MKSTAVLTALLTASLVLGAKWTQKRREAHEARKGLGRARTHSSRPQMVVDDPAVKATGHKQKGFATNNTYTAYSENWAGAALVSSGFTSVTGTITVPAPTSPQDGKYYAGAAWVGIDGATCVSAILQTGIDWYVRDGLVTYDAWYEFYPEHSYTFGAAALPLAAGDTVRLTVAVAAAAAAGGPGGGTATIENLTQGARAAHAFAAAPPPPAALCGANAEWIVEDFRSCDARGCGLVPLADFGALAFRDCAAARTTPTGPAAVTPATPGMGLMVIDIYQNQAVVTDCVVSDATVGCTYLT